MTERDAFIRRICEQPDEDTARLVFADWLDENGEPERAGWIRSQVAEPSRYEATIAMHDPLGWFTGMFALGDRASYGTRRGFICDLHLPCAPFLAHAEAIFRHHPVTKVRLTDRVPEPWPSYYCWHHTDDDRWPRHADELPMCLWRHLDRATAETDHEAHDLLSRACVSYGRDLAGLPPLPTPKAGAA